MSQALSGWMEQMHIFRFIKKYLTWFNPRLWLGHSRTFTELSISHSCCVFRVIVLLEGEPSAQSEVLNALDWVFIKAISIVGALSFSSTLMSPSVPAAEKQPHSMRLLPAHFTFGWYSTGDEQSWFPSNMMLRIDVHHTRESCFSESEGPLGAFSKCVFMCLNWRENWVWPHCHKVQIGGVLQWCLSFCRFPPSAYINIELN